MVAGCMVTEGAMKRGSNLRVIRGKQEEVEIVDTASECGISFDTFNNVKACYVGGRDEAESP
ncbi:hypothetical protein T492DRAFT_888419 [Pavlovales sp. CCMP2436]|nr:hypothetical protein T492DRAFT_888419 [Pavlovales sp. CCMP2436]